MQTLENISRSVILVLHPKKPIFCNNKPGPAQVGAISKAQNSKKTSKCQVFFYSSRKSKIFRNFFLKKLHTKKMDRVARRGSLAR